MIVAGIDIGGTKCATIVADVIEESIKIISRVEIKTIGTHDEIISQLKSNLIKQLSDVPKSLGTLNRIGISCGGPLDSKKGIIQSPPNLPGWDQIPICQIFEEVFKVPVKLLNDADASAVAEWKYGAGKGFENVVFITFGTGLGAGLILNNKLYSGARGMAGEIGHIRLTDDGPIGYGKKGSFEGYCSGGGIYQQIKSFIKQKKSLGITKDWFNEEEVSAKRLSELARQGDELALELFKQVGSNFGKGLSIILDILNPDIIIVGGIYMRSHQLFDDAMYNILKIETLPQNLEHVAIKPSLLGEEIGDYAAICAGLL